MDLYLKCLNVLGSDKVYIYNENGKCIPCDAKKALDDYGEYEILWFCFRKDGAIEVMFKRRKTFQIILLSLMALLLILAPPTLYLFGF